MSEIDKLIAMIEDEEIAGSCSRCGFVKEAKAALAATQGEIATITRSYEAKMDCEMQERINLQEQVDAARKGIEELKGELDAVDMALARRPALDPYPNRTGKIMHAIEVAKRAEQAEAALDASIKEVGEIARKLGYTQAERDNFKESEKVLSDAYLRIRALVNAWDTARDGHDKFIVTENAVKKLKAERENWRETATQYSKNQDYYTELLDKIAANFGKESFISDDGSVQDSPLRAKMPELVRELKAERDEAVRLHNELIMQVEQKVGGLSRHEACLRLIKNCISQGKQSPHGGQT